jgi:group I intron endonuclease
MYTIYLIQNHVNDKLYVGQTKCGLSRRWKTHLTDLKRGEQQPLYKAMRKYGVENFTCEPFLTVETKAEADYQERIWILLLGAHISKHGYVCTWGGDGWTGISPHMRKARAKTLRATLAADPTRHSRFRADISDEEIKRLYVDEMWTRKQIAAKFNCSPTLIDKRMQKAGVRVGQGRHKHGYKINPEYLKSRLPAPRREASPVYRHDLDNNEMVCLYRSGLSLKEVAAIVGCSAFGVKNRLVNHLGMQLRPTNNIPNPDFDTIEIINLYQTGMSTKEVGQRLGCSSVTVRNRLKGAGVPIRPSKFAPRNKHEFAGSPV